MRWLLILLMLPLASALDFNEVHFNPEGDDNNREFVEVRGEWNLSGYIFGDLASNDTLVPLKVVPGELSLIVEEGFDHSSLNCSIWSAGSSLGNNLNNDLDAVFLYKDGALVAGLEYNATGIVNKSLEFDGASWSPSCAQGGSPCEPNCLTNNTIGLNESNSGLGNETTDELAPESNSTANDTVQNFSIDPCKGAFLYIETDKQLYSESESVTMQMRVSNLSNFTIEYWVEDLFGELAKPILETSNLNPKKFTPKLNEPDKVFVARSKEISCNLSAQTYFFVVGEPRPDMPATLSIEDVDDKNLKMGDVLKFSVFIRKQGGSKHLVEAALKRKGKTASLPLKFYINQDGEYNLTLFLQLKECKGFESGEYDLVLEGLGMTDEKSLLVGSCAAAETVPLQPASEIKLQPGVTVKRIEPVPIVEPDLLANPKSESRNEKVKPDDQVPTGSVVYESEQAKLSRLSPLLVVVASFVVGAGLFIRDRFK